MGLRIIIKTCLLLFTSFTALAIDPQLDWKTLETDNFYIHYPDGYKSYSIRVANIARNAHHKLQPLIEWQPLEKTHLIISDHADFANGYATPNHFNRSVIFLTPPDTATGIEDYDDWLTTLILHEYTHILHLDKSHGLAAFMRKVFGRHFLMFPNSMQPGWLIEGLATYHETNIATGRGQSSLFQSMMRAELEQGLKPVSQVNLPMRSWPMGSSSYLYGVYFYEFMVDAYGYEIIQTLIREYSDNLIPFSINANAKRVLKKDMEELWREFEIYLEKRFKKDQSVGIGMHNNGRKITSTGYHTDQYSVINNGSIYYIKDQVYDHASLNVIENGEDRYLINVNSQSRLDVHKEQGVLIMQPDFCDEYNINYDIYKLDKRNQIKRITYCGRYRSAAWSGNGQSIYAVKLVKGESWLVQLDIQGKLVGVLWKGVNSEVVSQIKHSPTEEKLVAAVQRLNKGWNIEEFDLASGQWLQVTDDSHLDMYPSYSEDGNKILYSSDRLGKFQIYRFNKDKKMTELLTNVSYAAFSPVQLNKDSSLYYVGYHKNGRDVFQIDEVYPITVDKTEYTKRINSDETISLSEYTSSEYSALQSMRPRWWFPSIQLDEEQTELGFVTTAHDALSSHFYRFNLRYDTENDWISGGASYVYRNRYVMGYQRTTNVIVDQENEFALSREQDDIFGSVLLSYPGYDQYYRFQFGVLLSREKDGERDVNISSFPELRDNLFGVSFNYGSTSRYIRSISETDGAKVRVIAESSDIYNSDFSGEIYTLDWKQFISLGSQHVMAVRIVQGYGTEKPEKFRLGGELNDYNLLDLIETTGDPLLGKRKYSLRGYKEGLPELSGRRIRLATVEWRFPGQLVERGWMTPPVGLIQWSGKIFAETGAAYEASSPEKYYSSFGLELDADVNLFYGITTRMRLGFAHGYDEGVGEERIYFSLGASF